MTHLSCALEVELVVVELEPLRVGENRTRLHAEQGSVGGEVLVIGVVKVVGSQERKADLLRKAQ